MGSYDFCMYSGFLMSHHLGCFLLPLAFFKSLYRWEGLLTANVLCAHRKVELLNYICDRTIWTTMLVRPLLKSKTQKFRPLPLLLDLDRGLSRSGCSDLEQCD